MVKLDQNSQDMVDILGDITSGKTVEDSNKRDTLHLPPRGAFMDIIRDAENKINIAAPQGRFGSKRHQRHPEEEKK